MLLEGYQIMKKLRVEGYYCVNKRKLNAIIFLFYNYSYVKLRLL